METGGHSGGRQDDERPAEGSGELVRDREAAAGARDSRPARVRFDFERGWVIVAVVLLVASATLLYSGHPEAAFVVAALGVSAWFLNVRNGLKRRHDLVKRGGRNWQPRGRVEEEEQDSFEGED